MSFLDPPGDPNPAMSTTATTDMMVNHGNGNTQAILVTAPPSLHPRCGSPLGLYGASCQQASRASITNDGRLARILTNESRSRRRSFYASTDPCQPTRSNQSGRNDSTRTGGHAVSTRCLGSGENFRSSHFNRARARTLRMTVLIVLAFILCWTPTVVMSLWFLIDSDSVEKSVDPRVADVLFILTITNSVVNPYVYGSYASEMRTKCLKWFGLARSRDRLAGNGTIGLGGTASLLSQGPGPTSGGGIQPRGYFTQSERRSPRFVWSHRQTRTNRNHCSLASSNANNNSNNNNHSSVENGAIQIQSPSGSWQGLNSFASANFIKRAATGEGATPTSDGNAIHLQFSSCFDSSSVSENQERKAPIFLKRMPKRGKHRKLMRKWYCRTTIGRRFLLSSEHIVETPPTNGAVPKRKRRIRRSQSLTTKLPSWEKDAAKTRKAHRSCIISHLNDMPEDISVFDTSPIWSPILSRKSSARSARSRQTQRWTKLKRSRSLSELKIYL